MTAATIDTIALAIEAALRPLTTQQGGSTFRLVEHWAGGFSPADAAANINAGVLNQTPAALIAFEREPADDDVRTNAGGVETLGESTWGVVVVSPAAGQSAKVGQVAAPSPVVAAYKLVEPVQAKLNNLVIAGLVRAERLHCVGTQWFAVERGKLYALIVRFVARRVLPDATLTDPSHPYAGMTGTVSLNANTDAGAPLVPVFNQFKDIP